MKNLGRAFQFFRPESKRLVMVGVLMLSGIGADLLKPWPLALIVDSVLGEKPAPSWLQEFTDGWTREGLLAALAGAVPALHLAQSALSSAQNFLAIQVGLSGLRRVRNEVFAGWQRLSVRFQCSALQTRPSVV